MRGLTAALALMLCGQTTTLDVIPSMARFRMPFRTVESESDVFRPASRASTNAVAASLRAQHRTPALYMYASDFAAAEPETADGGHHSSQRFLGLHLHSCCVCQERFESADGGGKGAQRAQLIECGHEFCTSCVGTILEYQGKGCSEITSRQCGSCSGSDSTESLAGTRSSRNSGAQDKVCTGCWAPCPLCRVLYSRDQVRIASVDYRGMGRKEDNSRGRLALLREKWFLQGEGPLAPVSNGGSATAACDGAGSISQATVSRAIRYALECLAAVRVSVSL
jgi:hypothetical protein